MSSARTGLRAEAYGQCDERFGVELGSRSVHDIAGACPASKPLADR